MLMRTHGNPLATSWNKLFKPVFIAATYVLAARKYLTSSFKDDKQYGLSFLS